MAFVYEVRLTVGFDEALAAHLSGSLARLAYLFPTLEFAQSGNRLDISGSASQSASVVVRETRYAVYREKIAAEAAPLRIAMFEALFG